MYLKKAGDIISTVLIVLLLVLLCAVLVPKLCFGVEMKAVMTASMQPELPVGSLVVIVPTDYDDINIGDDITFVRDESLTLVTHRVIEKDDSSQRLTTQGIANNAADAPTSYQNVVGKVVWHIPFVGYLVIWLSTLHGKIIAVIIIAALVSISLLFDKYGDDKSKKDDKNKKEENLKGGQSDEIED